MLYSHDQLYKHIIHIHLYMHAESYRRHNNTRATKFLEKYTPHFIERVVCERELETEQNCNILTPHSIGHNRFFPVLLVGQPEAWGPSLSGTWSSIQHLLFNFFDPHLLIGGSRAPSAGCWLSLSRLVSKLNDFLSSPSYIIVQRPPSCGRPKLHSSNPSTVHVILCYSSTECICYLYRCISYFDSPAGS